MEHELDLLIQQGQRQQKAVDDLVRHAELQIEAHKKTVEQIQKIEEALKKKLESELVLEIDRDELKGDKGDTYEITDKDYQSIAEKTKELIPKGFEFFTKEELTSIAKTASAFIPKPENGKPGKPGAPGKSVDEDKVIKAIIELIPKPKNGEDYILTDEDKKEIVDEAVDKTTPEVIQRIQPLIRKSGGPGYFRELSDVPGEYKGQAGKVVTVKETEDGLEFANPSGGGLTNPVDFIEFNTSPTEDPAEGKMYWNAQDGTLNIGMAGGIVNLQVGQEQLLKVRNNSGATIGDAKAVYVSGALGNRPTIGLADADSFTAHRTIALTTQSINDNADGFVTINGLVRDVDTSAFAEGDPLYVSDVAGEITNNIPIPPQHKILIGYCLRSHITQGVILVSIRSMSDLDELDNVKIENPTNGQVLAYNQAEGWWENQDQTGGTVTPTTTLTVDVTTDLASEVGNLRVYCDATNGPITITIPNANPNLLIFKKVDATSNEVTLTMGAGDSIEGDTTLVLSEQNESVSLIQNGANWNII